MVREVEPDGPFMNSMDLYAIMGYNFERMYKWRYITSYLTDINEYHQEMIEKEHISANNINRIFENVRIVDANYNLTFAQSSGLLGQLTGLINLYAKTTLQNDIAFCSQNSLAALEGSIQFAAYKEAFIENYEAEHPRVRKKMNKAFAEMAKTHKADVDNIKYIVYSAEEPYRSLFTDNVGDVKICKTDEGSSYNDSGKIYINWDNPLKMADDPRGPYEGFFHEYGHFLDDKYHIGIKYTSDAFETSSGLTLEQSIKKDVQAATERKIREMYPDLSDKEVADIRNRLTKGNLPGYKSDDSDDIIEAAKKVQDEICNDLSSPFSNGVSDTYDSATNYLRGDTNKNCIPYGLQSGNTGKGLAGGWQHNDSYYYKYSLKKNKLTIKRKTAASGPQEGFATYYSNKMLGWTDYSSYYTEYLPSTTVGFGEVIDYMANN